MNHKDLRRAYSAMKVTSLHRRMKVKAVEYKGGKCQECGYCKSLAALTFHHRNPEEKDFSISGRVVKWEKLKPELDKCDLLCSNCHLEEHERLTEEGRSELYTKIRKLVPERQKPVLVMIPCHSCGKKVQRPKTSKTNIFCNQKCTHVHLERVGWPDKEELEKLVWERPVTMIAKELGVSDKAIKKRCVKLGITTPGMGYWSKQNIAGSPNG